MLRRLISAAGLLLLSALLVACGNAVPNVVGMPKDKAEQVIRSSGSALGTVSFDGQRTDASGNVVSQSPEAGARVKTQERVNLVIAGLPPVRTPSVLGLKEDAAVGALTAAGLAATVPTRAYDGTVASGVVLSQEPTAGAMTPNGAMVTLVISKGLHPASIPSVKGRPQADATKALESAGFKVDVEKKDSAKKEGTVLDQKPSGAAQRGATVTITVAKSGIYTPARGSALRQALMDAVRKGDGDGSPSTFIVHELYVKGDWAVGSLSISGPEAEVDPGHPFAWRRRGGVWTAFFGDTGDASDPNGMTRQAYLDWGVPKELVSRLNSIN